MTRIRPGTAISLVVNSNVIREINDIRTSMVYDQAGKKLIIAQTDPFLLSDNKGKTITISFLTLEKGEPIRYGFQAKLVELIRDYALNPSQSVPAVVVVQKTGLEPYNLRMFYRIQPPSDFGLWMSIFDQPVSIIDVSIGGAIAAAPAVPAPDFKYEIEGLLKVTLTIDDENPKGRRTLQIVAMEFCDRTPELDRTLGEKILNIQRELRSKGLEA
jgi:hypothetical protein